MHENCSERSYVSTCTVGGVITGHASTCPTCVDKWGRPKVVIDWENIPVAFFQQSYLSALPTFQSQTIPIILRQPPSCRSSCQKLLCRPAFPTVLKTRSTPSLPTARQPSLFKSLASAPRSVKSLSSLRVHGLIGTSQYLPYERKIRTSTHHNSTPTGSLSPSSTCNAKEGTMDLLLVTDHCREHEENVDDDPF